VAFFYFSTREELHARDLIQASRRQRTSRCATPSLNTTAPAGAGLDRGDLNSGADASFSISLFLFLSFILLLPCLFAAGLLVSLLPAAGFLGRALDRAD
jgi:hypothetical protein